MIGEQFADRVSSLPRVPGLFVDSRCPVCGGLPGECVEGPVVGRVDEPRVEVLVAERAKQQSRRPPGRPSSDPEREARRVAEWGAKQGEVSGPVVEPAPVKADPLEVRDVYRVPAGKIDPVDDPHRPDPATTVLVTDDAQLVDTGAWMTLPGGVRIATTRDVLRVFYPWGTASPSYALVAGCGAVLPKPAEVAA